MELTPEQKKLTELTSENEKLKADLKKLQARKSGLFIHEQTEEVELDVYEKGKLPVLKRVSDKDVVCGGKDQLLIEGDNLHTLMALQITHRNKVDVIYIDPPYNTGNKDFKYNDHFVDKEDNWRHNKWLSFMSRRLRLARELMSDSGVIFISIDDNEQAQLKLLCDDVFGEENFLNILNWKTRGVGGQVKDGALITQVEYILCYSKNKNDFSFKKLKHPDAGSERWQNFRKTGGQWQRKYRPKQFFPFYLKDEKISLIETPEASKILPLNSDKEEGFWQNGVETTTEKINNGSFRARKIKEKYIIEQRIIVDEYINVGTFIDIPSVSGHKDINDFGLKFNNTKPVSLIKYILSLSADKNAIILDFFAGSGTTGQAVLELNKEDCGNRQFILATNNENNICEEITRERIKRVMEGYTNSKQEDIAGLGNNLRYFKTDFVANSNVETQLRINLNNADAYGDMICVGENVFGIVKETAYYKIFENDNKTVAFVKSDKNLTGLVDHLKQAKGKKKIYKFELEDVKDPDFEELFDGVEGVKFFGINSIIRSYTRLMRRK